MLSSRPEARVAILRIHSRKVSNSTQAGSSVELTRRLSQMSLQRGINLRALAEKMGNCSGAEVRGICTEAGASGVTCQSDFSSLDRSSVSSAGMYALRERRQHVTQEDFEMSIAKYVTPIGAMHVPVTDHEMSLPALQGLAQGWRFQHEFEQAVQLEISQSVFLDDDVLVNETPSFAFKFHGSLSLHYLVSSQLRPASREQRTPG